MALNETDILSAVVTNPEDPNFDLEKYIASFDK